MNYHFMIRDLILRIENILFSFPSAKVNSIINEMLRITKPNGYIECCEVTFPMKKKNVRKTSRRIDISNRTFSQYSGRFLDMLTFPEHGI